MNDKIGDLYRYILSVRKRWPLMLAIVASVMLIGVVKTVRTQKLYKASASMVIMPEAPRVLTGLQEVNPAGTTANFWAEEAFLQTEYRIMAGRQVLKRVFEKMNLGPKNKGVDPYDFLSPYVSVVPDKKTRIVNIEVVHHEPKFATNLANTIAAVYLDYKIDRQHSASGEASDWLQIQHEELKKKLEASENKLYEYMESHGILNASLESQMETVKNRISLFVGKLAETEAEQITRRSDTDALTRMAEDTDKLETLAEVQKAPLVTDLRAKLMALKRTKLDLSERYLTEHPRLKALDVEIAAVAANLKDAIANAVQILEQEQRALLVTERGLEEAIATEREQEANLNRLGLDYGRLKREVDINAKLYDLVANRLKEIGLTGMLRSNNVSMLDVARVPTSPYKPDWNMNMGVSFLIALMLAIGLALLLEYIDQTFKGREDVEELLKLPFLGVLPVIELEENAKKHLKARSKQEIQADARVRDLFVFNNPKSSVAECSRAIRTNLLFMTPDKPFRSLLVSSSMAGEGKTTMTLNLATAMAQAGSRVLLVDADLRRPRIHKSFQVSNDVGLSSLLIENCKLDQAVVRSPVENLDILPCGPIPPNPSELLHTAKFREVYAELLKSYDKVIFDSAPISAVTDSVVLSTIVDGTMLVIKTGVTHREAVKRAVRSLQDAHANILGVVLNDLEANKTEYGYSYSRYYWYGNYYYGYGEGQKSPI